MNFLIFILNFIVLFTFILGTGLFVWEKIKKQNTQLFISLMYVIALGLTFLSIGGWLLGMVGIFNRPVIFAVFLLSIFSIIYYGRIYKKSLLMITNSFNSISILNIATIFILTIIIFPKVIEGFSTPFISPNDAYYTWNTWAQHWGVFSEMRRYFVYPGYTQLLPIISSYTYKFFGTSLEPLSLQNYFNHGFQALIGLLGFLTLYRAILQINSPNKLINQIVGFTLCSLLFSEAEMNGTFLTGRPEIYLFFFSSLLIYELITIVNSPKLLERGDLIRSGIILAGLSFCRGTGFLFALLWIFVVIVDSFFTKTKLIQLDKSQRFKNSIKTAFILSTILILLIGPFILQQEYIGMWTLKAYGVHPLNFSIYGPGMTSAFVEQSATGDFTYMKMAGITSKWKLAIYHLYEQFLPKGLIGKPLFFETPLYSYAIMLLFCIGLILSLSNYWTLALFLSTIIYSIAWWIVASYGRYHLIVIKPPLIMLVGIGLIKILSSFTTFKVFRKEFFRYSFYAFYISILFYTFFLNNISYQWALGKRFNFLSQSAPERYGTYFPQTQKGYDYIFRLHFKEFDYIDPNKFLIVAEYPMDRFLPNSSMLQWIFKHKANLFTYIADMANDDLLSIITTNKTWGASRFEATWVKPSKKFWKKLNNKSTVTTKDFPLENVDEIGFILNTRDDKIEKIEHARLSSYTDWIVTLQKSDWEKIKSGKSFSIHNNARALEPRNFVFPDFERDGALWIGYPLNLKEKIEKDSKVFYIHKKLNLPFPSMKGNLKIAGDNFKLYLNGEILEESQFWNHMKTVEKVFFDGDIFTIEINDSRDVAGALFDLQFKHRFFRLREKKEFPNGQNSYYCTLELRENEKKNIHSQGGINLHSYFGLDEEILYNLEYPAFIN